MNEKIQSVLNTLPHKPGIYLMKDAQGTILYVGKAISLYHRVRSYFQESSNLSPKNRSMVAKVDDIEFLVVKNEVEALVLESNYIKQYRPKYNVLLRDDKNYPYIKVSLTEDFPRVYRVRSFQHDGNRYFGPYTSSGAVDATLDLLNKLFAFRTCRYDASAWAPPVGEPPAGWKQKLLSRPCTQYYIHRCIAPCVAYATREAYAAVIKQVILFLEGKHDEVLKTLHEKMEEAAENLRFEEAARIRDRIKAVENIMEKQRIISTEGQDDQDVIALASGEDETCAQTFFFRNGKLVGREYFILQGTRDSSPGEVMTSFLQQFYENSPHIPAEIIAEVEPDDRSVILAWLKEKRKQAVIRTAGGEAGGTSSTVTITVPKRGEKLRLVEMVKQNAKEVLEQQRIKWLTDNQKTQLALEELQEALNLAAPPQRIECYDISNTQGTNSVGAMVVFEAGRPKNSEYRRFKIKSVEGPNDFASHQEMLRRRFRMVAQTGGVAQMDTAAVEEDNIAASSAAPNSVTENGNTEMRPYHDWALPDLIIIDGGKGQLSAAMEVLQELHVDIPTVALAKENEEIFVPGSPDPILLPRSSQGLYLVQRIRDEAHRFGITYHRKLRSDRTFKSVLDEIPGIGPKRKQALMKHFGSIRAMSAASIDDLAALDGMTRDAAEKVKEYIGRVKDPRLEGGGL